MEEMMQTRRLYIVPLTLDHAEKVYALTSQEKVARYMRFDTHSSLSQAENLCAEWIEKGCHAYWIEEKQTGNPVGVFALKPEEEKDVYSLSAFQAPSSWNQGYNKELLSFFCKYARKQWGAKALTAYVVGENMASRRSLERNGFFPQEKIPVADLPSGLYRYRLEWGKEKGNVL